MGFTKTVIFLAQFRDDLLAIGGDRGGSAVIERMTDRVKPVPIMDSRAGLDIDTQEEYEKIEV